MYSRIEMLADVAGEIEVGSGSDMSVAGFDLDM
jgi:hypothetical protein